MIDELFLSDEDNQLLNTPIVDLNLEQRLAAFVARDKKEDVIRRNNANYVPLSTGKIYVISDDLGIKGVFNHVDGKRYDSKSQYYKAVKEAGCVVLGNDAPTAAKGPEAKIDMNELKSDINTAIQQLEGRLWN